MMKSKQSAKNAASRKSSGASGGGASGGGGLLGDVGLKLAVLVGLAAWAFVLVALWSFHSTDWPSHTNTSPEAAVANRCGPIGARIAYSLVTGLGWGAWTLTLLTGAGLLLTAMGRAPKHLYTRLLGVVILTLAVSGLQNLMFSGSGPYPDISGGKLGVVLIERLRPGAGPVGAGILMIFGVVVGLLVSVNELVSWMWNFTRERGVPAANAVGAATGRFAGEAVGVAAPAMVAGAKKSGGFFSRLGSLFRGGGGGGTDENGMNPVQVRAMENMRARKAKRASDVPQAVFPGEGGAGGGDAIAMAIEPAHEEEAPPPHGLVDPDAEVAETDDEDAAEIADADDRDADAGATPRAPTHDPTDEDELPGAPQVFDKDALREKMAKLPVVFGQENRTVATDADLAGIQSAEQLEIEGKQYRFPALDILENPEENFNERLAEYVREQGAALEAAMQEYGIDGEVVGIESGPVITLFDVKLAPGTKVAAVQAVSSDIARALKAVNIRIVPNQVGRDTIGVEVPNTTKEKVRLKELMGKTEVYSSMKLPMFMGKDASGEPLIEDLTKMPHMLIAGTTGSGKSVCMNTIIMGFLYTKKPSELKLVLVDPKMVEMSQFRDIPHLMCPVVTEMGKAAAILEWACTKMDERYELLADAGCRDIGAYNDLPWEELKERLGVKTDEEAARIPRKLPYMVFIIDELADLMMTAKEVESHIIRIAQKARAVGLHLILATQRPQANVVTGLIKSNMPCRVAFRVASGMDSRIVLDSKGAELLLGHGDMLFLNPRTNKMSRAQGTLVDDKEIRAVVKFMREVAGPSFERQLLQLRRPSEGGGAGGPSGLGGLSDEERLLQSKNNSSASLAAAQEDPLFERAVEIVLETRRGSVSLLQRRLAIGYTRSSRLIDLMGIAGIISDHKGSVARDVLITEDEWAAMKKLAREEAAAKGIAWPTGKPEQADLFAAGGAAAEVEAKPEDSLDDDEDEEGDEETPFEATSQRADDDEDL